MRASSSPTVLMISFDEDSTLAARSFTASATTPKPRPASPARLASTDALNATSRVCNAICVIVPAADDTWRSVETMPATSVPTSSTALRARSTAPRLSFDTLLMPSCARVISCTWPASADRTLAWPAETLCVSSIRPRTSAASRPMFDACLPIESIAACMSIRLAGGSTATVATGSTGLLFLKALNMLNFPIQRRQPLRIFGSILAQLDAQAGDRLAVQLANARLRDFEHGCDFLQIHVVLVVHAHHVLLALGQRLDRLDERFAHARVLQLRERVEAFVADMPIEVVVIAFVARHVFQIDELRAAHLAQQLLVFGERDPHLFGNLAFGRRAAEPLLELVHRRFYAALLLADSARQVVVAAQLVEHRAANALRREGLELHALRSVEARQRVGESDHADLNQVIDLDVGRQLGDHLVRQAPHQRAVLLEHRAHVELAFGGVHVGSGSQFSAPCAWCSRAGDAAAPAKPIAGCSVSRAQRRSAAVGCSRASVAGSICTQSRNTAPRKSSAQVASCIAMRSARGELGAAPSSKSCTTRPARWLSSFIAAYACVTLAGRSSASSSGRASLRTNMRQRSVAGACTSTTSACGAASDAACRNPAVEPWVSTKRSG